MALTEPVSIEELDAKSYLSAGGTQAGAPEYSSSGLGWTDKKGANAPKLLGSSAATLLGQCG